MEPMTNTSSPELRRRVRINALNMEVRARTALDENAVEEYADAMRAQAKFPPVVVFEEGETLWLADGHHRVEAARRVERMAIRAEIHAGGRREALLHACGANAEHGVRRTNADKRLAVTLMLRDKEWRQWSGREIARRCAVDEGLVRRVRDELSADDPQVAPAERKMIRASKEQTQKAAGERKRRAGGNQNHVHPDLPALPGFGALRSAWSAAGAAAREQFLRWLWSEHPEMIGAVMTDPRVTERQSTG
jgi:ParB-like nuclease family protein